MWWCLFIPLVLRALNFQKFQNAIIGRYKYFVFFLVWQEQIFKIHSVTTAGAPPPPAMCWRLPGGARPSGLGITGVHKYTRRESVNGAGNHNAAETMYSRLIIACLYAGSRRTRFNPGNTAALFARLVDDDHGAAVLSGNCLQVIQPQRVNDEP